MLENSRIRRQCGEHGYVLLTLLLIMALGAILAGVVASSMKFTMERDREEEMIHRGVQYSRAIRTYYRKFGRYPVKIEDLESTNNIRFLRKRYKDPLSCSKGKCDDFKLLHFGEVQMAMSGFGNSSIPGATPVSAMGGSNNPAALGQSLAFGQSGASAFGGTSSFGSSSTSSFSNSSFGQNQPGQNSTGTSGTDSSQAGSQSPDSSAASSSGTGNSGSNQPQIIGGPIVGVASTSKAKTIREFNHKKQYKDWLFIYDPSQDMGFLITTPYQPQMFGMNGTPNLNGQSGTSGNNGFGSGNSFGSSSGFGNSFGSFGSSSGSQNNQNSGSGNSNQQQNNSSQQQQ